MDGSSVRWRTLNIYCRCQKCHDLFNVTLYVRQIPGRTTRARLEASQVAGCSDGHLYHRPGKCDGIARALGLPEPMILEDRRDAPAEIVADSDLAPMLPTVKMDGRAANSRRRN